MLNAADGARTGSGSVRRRTGWRIPVERPRQRASTIIGMRTLTNGALSLNEARDGCRRRRRKPAAVRRRRRCRGSRRAVHPSDAARVDGDLAVARSPGHAARSLAETKAHLVLTTEGTAIPDAPLPHRHLCHRASRSDARRRDALFPPSPAATPGIHPSAVVAADATIGADVSIGPFTVVGAGATIGARTIDPLAGHDRRRRDDRRRLPDLPGRPDRLGLPCRRPRGDSQQRIARRRRFRLSCRPRRARWRWRAETQTAERPLRAQPASEDPFARRIVEIGDDVEIGALTSIDRGTLTLDPHRQRHEDRRSRHDRAQCPASARTACSAAR